MELKHKYWLCVFVGSICLVIYKPSWKGSRALDTWRNVPDKLWAVAVLVPKAAGLEIYWVNRIQQLEGWALHLEKYLFKNNCLPLQPWGLNWLLQHMGGGTRWCPELLVITPCKEVWPYSLTTAACQFSFLLFSCDKNNFTICTGCLNFCLWKARLTLWSPSLPILSA